MVTINISGHGLSSWRDSDWKTTTNKAGQSNAGGKLNE